MHESSGYLRYSNADGNYRLVVEVDLDLAHYYRSLIPKHYCVKPPRYKPHVTVVRPIKEMPGDLKAWNRYEGEEIQFFYDGIVHHERMYFWINIFCKRLEDIRKELGLEVNSMYTIPPDGFLKCFHSTIANIKT